MAKTRRTKDEIIADFKELLHERDRKIREMEQAVEQVRVAADAVMGACTIQLGEKDGDRWVLRIGRPEVGRFEVRAEKDELTGGLTLYAVEAADEK